MHVGVRLHLVHAAITFGVVAVTLLGGVRRSLLLRLRIQRLTVAIEGLGSLLRRGRLISRLPVDRGAVRGVGAGAAVDSRACTKGTTPRRRMSRRPTGLRLDLWKSRQSLAGHCWSRCVLTVVPGVDWASGVDRRNRWQLQFYGVDREPTKWEPRW